MSGTGEPFGNSVVQPSSPTESKPSTTNAKESRTGPVLTRSKSAGLTVEPPTESFKTRRSASIGSDDSNHDSNHGYGSPNYITGTRSPLRSKEVDVVADSVGLEGFSVPSSPSVSSRHASPRVSTKKRPVSPFDESASQKSSNNGAASTNLPNSPLTTPLSTSSASRVPTSEASSAGARNGRKGGDSVTTPATTGRAANAVSPNVPLSSQSSVNNSLPAVSNSNLPTDTFSLSLHGRKQYDHDIRLNPEKFPDIKVGDFVEVYSPDAPEGSRILVEVTSMDQVKGSFAVSIDNALAQMREVPLLNWSQVVVRKIKPTDFRIAFVEVSFKDQYVSQGEFYRLKLELNGKSAFQGKRWKVQGITVKVEELVGKGNKQLSCGVISESTKFIFRSKSARLFWLVQMSKEMWDFASDGELYFERFVNQLVSEIFDRWQAKEVTHSLTLVFFTRTFYNRKPTPKQLDSIMCASNREVTGIILGQLARKNYDNRWYIDMYQTVLENETRTDWHSLRPILKSTFLKFPNSCGWSIPNAATNRSDKWQGVQPENSSKMTSHSRSASEPRLEKHHNEGVSPVSDTPLARSIEASELGRYWEQKKSSAGQQVPGDGSEQVMDPESDDDYGEAIHGLPSTAQEGNLLEAISLCLNVLDKHYMDRDLKRTGQAVVLFTAGSGVFEVDRNLTRMIKYRMMDNAIGCDVISITRAPLHMTPLFVFKPATPPDYHRMDVLDTPHPYASSNLYILKEQQSSSGASTTGMHRSHSMSQFGSSQQQRKAVSASSVGRISSLGSEGGIQDVQRQSPLPAVETGQRSNSTHGGNIYNIGNSATAAGDEFPLGYSNPDGSVYSSEDTAFHTMHGDVEVKPVFNVPHWIHLSFPFHGSTAHVINNQHNEDFQPLPTNRMFRLHNPTRTMIPRALVIAMKPGLAEEWIFRMSKPAEVSGTSTQEARSPTLPAPPPLTMELMSMQGDKASAQGPSVANVLTEPSSERLPTSKNITETVPDTNQVSNRSSNECDTSNERFDDSTLKNNDFLVNLTQPSQTKQEPIPTRNETTPWYPLAKSLTNKSQSPIVHLIDMGTSFSSEQSFHLGSYPESQQHPNLLPYQSPRISSRINRSMGGMDDAQFMSSPVSRIDPWQDRYEKAKRAQKEYDLKVFKTGSQQQNQSLPHRTQSNIARANSTSRFQKPTISGNSNNSGTIVQSGTARTLRGEIMAHNHWNNNRTDDIQNSHILSTIGNAGGTFTSLNLQPDIHARQASTDSQYSTDDNSVDSLDGAIRQSGNLDDSGTDVLRNGVAGPNDTVNRLLGHPTAPATLGPVQEEDSSYTGKGSQGTQEMSPPDARIHRASIATLGSAYSSRSFSRDNHESYSQGGKMFNPGNPSPSSSLSSNLSYSQEVGTGLSSSYKDNSRISLFRSSTGASSAIRSGVRRTIAPDVNSLVHVEMAKRAGAKKKGSRFKRVPVSGGNTSPSLGSVSSNYTKQQQQHDFYLPASDRVSQHPVGGRSPFGVHPLSRSKSVQGIPSFGLQHERTVEGSSSNAEKSEIEGSAEAPDVQQRSKTSDNSVVSSAPSIDGQQWQDSNSHSSSYAYASPDQMPAAYNVSPSFGPARIMMGSSGRSTIEFQHNSNPLPIKSIGTRVGRQQYHEKLNPFSLTHYRSAERRVRMTHNRKRWSHLFPFAGRFEEGLRGNEQQMEIPLTLESYRPNWKSLYCPGVLPITTGFKPEHKLYRVSDVTLTATNEINGYRYSNNLELVIELICQRLSHDFQLYEKEGMQEGEESISATGISQVGIVGTTIDENSGTDARRASGSSLVSATTGSATRTSTTKLGSSTPLSKTTRSLRARQSTNSRSPSIEDSLAGSKQSPRNSETGSQRSSKFNGTKVKAFRANALAAFTDLGLDYDSNSQQKQKVDAVEVPQNEVKKNAVNRKLARVRLKPDQSKIEPIRTVSLTMGHEVHTFTFRANSGSISLKKSVGPRSKGIVQYPCLLFEPMEQKFDFANHRFELSHQQDNWNKLDGTIAGNSDDDPYAVSTALRYRRQAFSIVPPRADGSTIWRPRRRTKQSDDPILHITKPNSGRRSAMKRRITASSNTSEQSSGSSFIPVSSTLMFPDGGQREVDHDCAKAPKISSRSNTPESLSTSIATPLASQAKEHPFTLRGSGTSAFTSSMTHSLSSLITEVSCTESEQRHIKTKLGDCWVTLTPEQEERAIQDFKLQLKFIQSKIGKQNPGEELLDRVKILSGEEARVAKAAETITVKLNLQTKKSQRFEWMVLAIDDMFSPYQCYHIEVRWAVASARNVNTSFIRPLTTNNWDRSSLNIIQIPEYCRSTSVNVNRRVPHPFIIQKTLYNSCIWSENTVLERLVVNLLLSNFNFAVDSLNRHTIALDEDDVDVEEEYFYSLSHRDGLCMVNFLTLGIEFIRNGQRCSPTHKVEDFEATRQLCEEIEDSLYKIDLCYALVTEYIFDESMGCAEDEEFWLK